MEVHNPIARAAAKLRQHGHEADAANLESLVKQHVEDIAGDLLFEALQSEYHADDFCDRILDLVLGKDRPKWSAAYGVNEALAQVAEMMFAIDAARTPSHQLEAIRQAIRDYHFALDKRQHGVVAADTALGKVSDALGMQWVQGKEAAERSPMAEDQTREQRVARYESYAEQVQRLRRTPKQHTQENIHG